VLCLVLFCSAQDDLFPNRSAKIGQAEKPVLSGSDRTSHRNQKAEEHRTTPQEQKIAADADWSKSHKRVPRQSGKSALQNLKSIAAGKGASATATSRGRSRARVPIQTSTTQQITRRPIPSTRPTSIDLGPGGEKLQQNLAIVNIAENNNNEKTQQPVVEKEDYPAESEEETNSIDIKGSRPKPFRRRKNHPAKIHRGSRFGHRKFQHRAQARRKKQRLLLLKRLEEEDSEEEPVQQDATGCHQVCDTLIFEVYKLLRGNHCDCF